MATKSTVKVECKVRSFEDAQDGFTRVVLDCNIGMRTWEKELWLKYDRPISMEEFKRELKKLVMPKKETDNLRYVKQEANKPFIVSVDL